MSTFEWNAGVVLISVLRTAPSLSRHFKAIVARDSVVDMNEIVEKILIGYAGDVNDARAMVKRYLSLLASAGKTEEQLLVIGTAYLKEMLEPDSRYSGC